VCVGKDRTFGALSISNHHYKISWLCRYQKKLHYTQEITTKYLPDAKSQHETLIILNVHPKK
jgi:hypothetical protein